MDQKSQEEKIIEKASGLWKVVWSSMVFIFISFAFIFGIKQDVATEKNRNDQEEATQLEMKIQLKEFITKQGADNKELIETLGKLRTDIEVLSIKLGYRKSQ